MKQHPAERSIEAMIPEIDRDVLVYGVEVRGFAICVYRSGKRAFVLRYRIAGRSRHISIGSLPDWSVTVAREEAKRLKRHFRLELRGIPLPPPGHPARPLSAKTKLSRLFVFRG